MEARAYLRHARISPRKVQIVTMMQKIKSGMDRFRANHPKFPLFLRAVSQDALVEGSIIEINVTTPEGKNYCTNVKLKADDMELFDSFKNMQG